MSVIGRSLIRPVMLAVDVINGGGGVNSLLIHAQYGEAKRGLQSWGIQFNHEWTPMHTNPRHLSQGLSRCDVSIIGGAGGAIWGGALLSDRFLKAMTASTQPVHVGSMSITGMNSTANVGSNSK